MTNSRPKLAATLAVCLTLTACAGRMAPTVAIMPAPSKPFEVFQQDQALCQTYANNLLAPLVQQANAQAVGVALISTALGAALGAAVGGGQGAGIGAASGAIFGTSSGVLSSQFAGMTLQQQFDIAFAQCMYSKGDQVPGFQPNVYVLPPPPPPPPS